MEQRHLNKIEKMVGRTVKAVATVENRLVIVFEDGAILDMYSSREDGYQCETPFSYTLEDQLKLGLITRKKYDAEVATRDAAKLAREQAKVDAAEAHRKLLNVVYAKLTPQERGLFNWAAIYHGEKG